MNFIDRVFAKTFFLFSLRFLKDCYFLLTFFLLVFAVFSAIF